MGFYSGFLAADRMTVISKPFQGKQEEEDEEAGLATGWLTDNAFLDAWWLLSGEDRSQYRWESSAGSSFTVAEDDSEPIEGSGTRIILHLKVRRAMPPAACLWLAGWSCCRGGWLTRAVWCGGDQEDCDEYLDPVKLKSLLQRYSEFVQFPIELFTEKTEYEQVRQAGREAGPGRQAGRQGVADRACGVGDGIMVMIRCLTPRPPRLPRARSRR